MQECKQKENYITYSGKNKKEDVLNISKHPFFKIGRHHHQLWGEKIQIQFPRLPC